MDEENWGSKKYKTAVINVLTFQTTELTFSK